MRALRTTRTAVESVTLSAQTRRKEKEEEKEEVGTVLGRGKK